MVTTKANMTKLIVSTMLIALLSAHTVSVAFASLSEDGAQTSTEDNPQVIGEDSMLYASEDNATMTDDNPVLIQQRDNATNTTDGDSSAELTDDVQSEDNPSLIAPHATSDNAAITVAIAAVAAIAVGASVAVILIRRK